MNLREAAQRATPREQLLKELMDPRVPKTEREHAAVREIERLRTALAEDPMQRLADVQQEMEATIKDNLTVEPVAWLQIGMGDHEGTAIVTTTEPKTWNPAWWKFKPLYAAPPKRKPLTPEEIQECVAEVDDTRLAGPITELIRATERKLGIGGEE